MLLEGGGITVPFQSKNLRVSTILWRCFKHPVEGRRHSDEALSCQCCDCPVPRVPDVPWYPMTRTPPRMGPLHEARFDTAATAP